MSLKSRFLSLDPVITGMTAAMLVFGLVMLMSATGPIGVARTGDSLSFVKHQIFSGLLPGMVAFFTLAIIDYRHLRPLAFFALLATFVLLILVYIPGIGLVINGSRSWVHLGPIQFQPSELVKLTFLIYLSAWLAARQGSQGDVQASLLPFLGTLGAVILLLVLQPDTGTMVVIVCMSLAVYFLSGAPITWFVLLGGMGATLITMLIKLSPYRAARFMTFLHPELDPKGIGYHINQAILAIGSGGLWGVGYGHSRQKFLYLPEVESDSISAVIAEEMGFIVIVVMLAAFGYLIWRCFLIARESKDPFGASIAAGVGAWIAIQVIMNIGSMCGLLPITGITLPLISHGGSATTVLCGALGLVAGIPRSAKMHL